MNSCAERPTEDSAQPGQFVKRGEESLRIVKARGWLLHYFPLSTD